MEDNSRNKKIISINEVIKQKSKTKISEHVLTLEEELDLILNELIDDETNREV